MCSKNILTHDLVRVGDSRKCDAELHRFVIVVSNPNLFFHQIPLQIQISFPCRVIGSRT